MLNLEMRKRNNTQHFESKDRHKICELPIKLTRTIFSWRGCKNWLKTIMKYEQNDFNKNICMKNSTPLERISQNSWNQVPHLLSITKNVWYASSTSCKITNSLTRLLSPLHIKYSHHKHKRVRHRSLSSITSDRIEEAGRTRYRWLQFWSITKELHRLAWTCL